MKKYIIFIVMIILLIAFTGCNEGNNLLNLGEEDSKEKAKISKDITLPMLKFTTLNPILSNDADVYKFEKLIFEGLIFHDENLLAKPLLATSWTYGRNGYEVVFNLKTGVTWHDGTSFTAKDVKFTIDSLIRNKNSSIFGKYVKNISNARIESDYSIKINFMNNINNSIDLFIFPIMQSNQFKGNASNFMRKSSEYLPIGTGPYKVEEFLGSSTVKLSANSDYHGKVKADNTLTFQSVPNREVAVDLFSINEIKVMYTDNIDRQKVFADKEVILHSFTSNEVEVIGFNFSSKVAGIEKFRKALSLSIDRDAIINDSYLGNGVLVNNIYPQNYLGRNSFDDSFSFDIAKAKKILSEAGFSDIDKDILLEDPDENEFIIRILVNSENINRILAAEIIKKSLDNLQIESVIISEEWEEYNKSIKNGSYDIYIGGFGITEDVDFRFALNSRNNLIKYKNTELDTLLDAHHSYLTPEEKIENFRSIKFILEKELPYFPLLYKTHAMVSVNTMQTSIKPLFYNIYNNCFGWKYTY